MECSCAARPSTWFLDEAPRDWVAGLEQVAVGNWKTLHRCRDCGSFFSVDAWDKYQHQVVAKVSGPSGWEVDADDTDRRKALLLRVRGGLSAERCIWADCAQLRVHGVTYCVDHLWNSGCRR